jgi:hypothetical protein
MQGMTCCVGCCWQCHQSTANLLAYRPQHAWAQLDFASQRMLCNEALKGGWFSPAGLLCSMLLLLLRVCLHLCDPSAKRARGMRRQLKVSKNHLLLAVACCSWLKHVGPVASLAVLKLKQTPPHKLWLDSESTVKYRALFEKAVRQRAARQQGSVVCWFKLVLKM